MWLISDNWGEGAEVGGTRANRIRALRSAELPQLPRSRWVRPRDRGYANPASSMIRAIIGRARGLASRFLADSDARVCPTDLLDG